MPLGVVNGTARLEEHNPYWPKMAQVLIRQLKAIMGEDAIEIAHVGSTAIHGIPAKPLLDLAVGVRDVAIAEKYIDVFEKIEVHYLGERVPGQRMFYKANRGQDDRTHHIHFVRYEGESWNNYLDFRDYLNTHEKAAGRYAAVKRSLAKQFAQERARYLSGKDACIQELLQEAHAWRVQCGNREAAHVPVVYHDVPIDFLRHVKELHALLQAEGYKTWLVGGCIRDTLLGKKPDDWDVVTSAPLEDLVRIYLNHGIGFDATAYQFDMAYAVFDDDVIEVKSCSKTGIYPDLSKRDFTVNAMIYDLDAEELLDFFHGREDLDRRLIRLCREENILHNPGYILRAMRFCLELGMKIEPHTYEVFMEHQEELVSVKATRMKKEISTMLRYKTAFWGEKEDR